MIPVIGVAGQRRNGKDQVTKRLLTHLPSWSRGGFADAVKQKLCEEFKVKKEFVEEWKDKDEKPPGMDQPMRKSLVAIGDGYRSIKKDYWIDKEFKDKGYMYKIFSDERYINEAAAIRDLGGINIFVYRPGYINQDETPSEEWCGELARFFGGNVAAKCRRSVNLIDCVIKNDGTIADLNKKVDQAFEYIKARYNSISPQSKSGAANEGHFHIYHFDRSFPGTVADRWKKISKSNRLTLEAAISIAKEVSSEHGQPVIVSSSLSTRPVYYSTPKEDFGKQFLDANPTFDPWEIEEKKPTFWR